MPRARRQLADADAAMVTSYCPDGVAAGELVLEAPRPGRVFYELDTPVTLTRLAAGQKVDYLPPQGLGDFDLVLSYTGGGPSTSSPSGWAPPRGAALWQRRSRPVPARQPPPHIAPTSPTWAPSRRPAGAAGQLLVEPARRLPDRRFLIGGAQYPDSFPWSANIYSVRHLPPAEHRAFYSSSRLTLNVTRAAMARMGYCPSGRLFEAAACGARS